MSDKKPRELWIVNTPNGKLGDPWIALDEKPPQHVYSIHVREVIDGEPEMEMARCFDKYMKYKALCEELAAALEMSNSKIAVEYCSHPGDCSESKKECYISKNLEVLAKYREATK